MYISYVGGLPLDHEICIFTILNEIIVIHSKNLNNFYLFGIHQ